MTRPAYVEPVPTEDDGLRQQVLEVWPKLTPEMLEALGGHDQPNVLAMPVWSKKEWLARAEAELNSKKED